MRSFCLLLLCIGCSGSELPAPMLSAVEPATWAAGDTPAIVIHGEHFVADEDDGRFGVTIGGLDAENVARVGDTELRGVAPPSLAVGLHDLEVTTPSGLVSTLLAAVEVVTRPTCSDSVHNQDESDTDCGGLICDPCTGGQACIEHVDCDSDLCLDAGCPTVDSCALSIPACPSIFVGCTLDASSEYVLAEFPADSPLRFLVAANATDTIEVSMAFVTQVSPGATRIDWYEPGCSDLYSYQNMGTSLFELAQDGVFTCDEQVFELGDHLIEITTDMEATVSVAVRVN